MELLTPIHHSDYELIDTGNREKLERYGKYILARPEPQAVWQKSKSEDEWKKLADAWYVRSTGQEIRKHESEKGTWTRKHAMPEQWMISYQYKEMKLKFRLGLTSFGHIGVFPEQAENWNYIYDFLILNKDPQQPPLKVLNLFAYTGGASLAARAAGAEVTHVDSVKQVITWAREDMEASGLDNIRWVVEDALKFVAREARRGNQYDGIILDPPAYGRGPEGEKWVLEDSIDEMMSLCSKILETGNSFFILSLYSMGLSSVIGENLLKTHFKGLTEIQSGEMYFPDQSGRKLPLGTFARGR